MLRIPFFFVVVVFLAGCVGGEPDPAPQQIDTPHEDGYGLRQEGPGDTPLPTIPVPAQSLPTSQEPSRSPTEGDAGFDQQYGDSTTERVAARAGVGKRGQGYGGGIITEPISSYFKTRDRMAFGIQIPHAMRLFHAEHNRYPKDMEEFERVILQPAQIVLPELPEGHRYVFDPTEVDISNGETGLMVERPRQ